MDYLEILKRAERGPATEPEQPAPAIPDLANEKARSSPEESKRELVAATPDLPGNVLLSLYPLGALCRATLDANPAASKLTKDELRWIAEHLEAAVLQWLKTVFQPEYTWEATCPKGHQVTDGIFVRCLLGWCCERCRTVYRPEDCKLNLERKK